MRSPRSRRPISQATGLFVALPGNELTAEECGGDLTPFAAALDFEPPYRTEAVRRSETLRALGCRRIDVIELSGVDGERTLRVDGEHVFGSIPALERDDHVVGAHRISGETWEVETARL